MDGALDTGAGTVTVNAGTLQLGAANYFTGDTRIVGGTLLLANGSALQESALNMNSADSGTLSFSSGISPVILGSLKGSRNIVLQDVSGGPVELQVGNNNYYNVSAPTTTPARSVVPAASPRLARESGR